MYVLYYKVKELLIITIYTVINYELIMNLCSNTEKQIVLQVAQLYQEALYEGTGGGPNGMGWQA